MSKAINCKCSFIFYLCFELLVIIEKQIFDFLSFLWTCILLNFFDMVFIIVALIGLYQIRLPPIILYILFGFIWLAWNCFVICFYLNVGILDSNMPILNMNGGGYTWWVRKSLICSYQFFNSSRSYNDKDLCSNFEDLKNCNEIRDVCFEVDEKHKCLASIFCAEIGQSAAQIIIKIVGIIWAIIITRQLKSDIYETAQKVSDELEYIHMNNKEYQHKQISRGQIPLVATQTSLISNTQVNASTDRLINKGTDNNKQNYRNSNIRSVNPELSSSFQIMGFTSADVHTRSVTDHVEVSDSSRIINNKIKGSVKANENNDLNSSNVSRSRAVNYDNNLDQEQNRDSPLNNISMALNITNLNDNRNISDANLLRHRRSRNSNNLNNSNLLSKENLTSGDSDLINQNILPRQNNYNAFPHNFQPSNAPFSPPIPMRRTKINAKSNKMNVNSNFPNIVSELGDMVRPITYQNFAPDLRHNIKHNDAIHINDNNSNYNSNSNDQTMNIRNFGFDILTLNNITDQTANRNSQYLEIEDRFKNGQSAIIQSSPKSPNLTPSDYLLKTKQNKFLNNHDPSINKLNESIVNQNIIINQGISSVHSSYGYDITSSNNLMKSKTIESIVVKENYPLNQQSKLIKFQSSNDLINPNLSISQVNQLSPNKYKDQVIPFKFQGSRLQPNNFQESNQITEQLKLNYRLPINNIDSSVDYQNVQNKRNNMIIDNLERSTHSSIGFSNGQNTTTNSSTVNFHINFQHNKNNSNMLVSDKFDIPKSEPSANIFKEFYPSVSRDINPISHLPPPTLIQHSRHHQQVPTISHSVFNRDRANKGFELKVNKADWLNSGVEDRNVGFEINQKRDSSDSSSFGQPEFVNRNVAMLNDGVQSPTYI